MLRSRPLGVAATFLVLMTSLGSLGGEVLAPAHAEAPPATSSRAPVVPQPPSMSSAPSLRPPGSVGTSPGLVHVEAPTDALCPGWWDAAQDAGWGPETLRALDVVMHRESRCEPAVWNREDPMGGSRGLLQVNGSWTRWLRERGILSVKEDLFDPEVNLRAALAIYRYGVERYGFGWGPWGFRYVDPYQ